MITNSAGLSGAKATMMLTMPFAWSAGGRALARVGHPAGRHDPERVLNQRLIACGCFPHPAVGVLARYHPGHEPGGRYRQRAARVRVAGNQVGEVKSTVLAFRDDAPGYRV